MEMSTKIAEIRTSIIDYILSFDCNNSIDIDLIQNDHFVHKGFTFVDFFPFVLLEL